MESYVMRLHGDPVVHSSAKESEVVFFLRTMNDRNIVPGLYYPFCGQDFNYVKIFVKPEVVCSSATGSDVDFVPKLKLFIYDVCFLQKSKNSSNQE